jgi:hypothetical protein
VNAFATIVVALAAAIGAGLAAGVPVYITAQQTRVARREDWARQDQVAAALERRQNAAEAKAAEVARQLATSNRLVVEQNTVTNGKLAQIHELVNSNLTTQMEVGHTSLVQQLVLMREVVRLNREAGRPPESAALAAIAALEARVAELGTQLRDRAQATVIADSQLE